MSELDFPRLNKSFKVTTVTNKSKYEILITLSSHRLCYCGSSMQVQHNILQNLCFQKKASVFVPSAKQKRDIGIAFPAAV